MSLNGDRPTTASDGIEMFANDPLTVMISSRCNDSVLYQEKKQKMSVVRRDIKEQLERIKLAGHPVYRVWIHEDEAILPGDEGSWDQCMRRARQADVFLVLYNGNAGWSGSQIQTDDHIGICHAEFQEAFASCPGKVRSVQFPEIKAKEKSPDQRFQTYFQKQSILGAQVTTGEEAIKAAKDAVVAALLDLARAGVGFNSKGNHYAGEALAWTRMDFSERREVTTRVAVELLSQGSNTNLVNGQPNTVKVSLNGDKVAIVCDTIPSSMSTAAARELVGQPFLRDHLISGHLPPRVHGPVHLIACQKSVTESQALRQLGFPDAIVVSAPFGVYVADDVQKIQMVFVANCRDESTTRHQVQRFMQWLRQQGEDRLLAERAVSRRKIADLIRSQQK